MRTSKQLAALFFIVLTIGATRPVHADAEVVLRDTTGFPPPAAGMARLVVSRERRLRQDLKPEFVFVDRTPVGQLPQHSGVTAEVPAGLHKVWLGRGTGVETWVNMAAGGKYLVRLREVMYNGQWRADMVQDSPEGYADFAVENGLKLAITSPAGMGSLQRNLEKVKFDPKADSLTRLKVMARLTPPIQLSEAWYQDVDAPPAKPGEYELHPGRLVLDDTSLRYTRGDSVVLEIPRSAITSARYGGTKDDRPHPWIKIGYIANGSGKGATFTHTSWDSATTSYNRLFQELSKAPQ